jgi:hypothetical protein
LRFWVQRQKSGNGGHQTANTFSTNRDTSIQAWGNAPKIEIIPGLSAEGATQDILLRQICHDQMNRAFSAEESFLYHYLGVAPGYLDSRLWR